MRFFLLALLTTLALGPAAAADAAKTPKRCPSGAIRLTVARGSAACAAYPAPAKARTRVAVTARSLLAQIPRRHRPRVATAKLRRLDQVAARALAPTATRAVGARGTTPQGCAALQPGPLHSVPPAEADAPEGTTVEVARLTQEPADGSPVRVADVTAVIGDGSARRFKRVRSCWTWDPCPAADGTLHGSYEQLEDESLTITDPKTHRRLTSHKRISTQTDLVAHVGDDARVATYDLKTFVSVESGSDASTAGGHTEAYQPTKRLIATLTMTGINPRKSGPAGSVKGTVRGPKGDRLTRDEIDGMTTFVSMSLETMRDEAIDKGLIGSAEAAWYDRFICVTVALDPSHAALRAGQTIPIGVTARAKDGAEVHGALEADAINGTVTPGTSSAPGTLQYTAPQPLRDGDIPTVGVVVTSRRGRGHAIGGGSGPGTPPGPAQFRILDASLHTDSQGAKTSSDEQPCSEGGFAIHGETILNAASTGPETDLVTLKTTSAGHLQGDFTASVPAKASYSLVGCQGFSPETYCSTSFDRDYPYGQTIGMDFDAPSAGAQNATLTWSIPAASVGFVDYDDSVCNVSDMFGGLSYEQESQTVPMSAFRGSQPFTLEFDGQADWTTDGHGKPATLHMDWKYFLTMQRVGG